jgi:hypothetical protein
MNYSQLLRECTPKEVWPLYFMIRTNLRFSLISRVKKDYFKQGIMFYFNKMLGIEKIS